MSSVVISDPDQLARLGFTPEAVVGIAKARLAAPAGG
jgi:hypothetical protein